MELELINFFTSSKLKNIEPATPSAYYQNRLKMSCNFAKDIMHKLNEEFYADNEEIVKLYKGMRLLAIDGSKLTLPNTEALTKKYGQTTNLNRVKGLTTGQISCLYDLSNKMILDANLKPYHTGEREQALEHLNYCQKNDLLICDRGYPSYEFISEVSAKCNYLIRCKSNTNKEIKEFVSSKIEDKILELSKPNHLKGPDLNNKIQKVRLLKIKLNTGDEEILITNLLDKERFLLSEFKDLYFKRWKIETNYDVLKNILEIENLSSYSEKCMKQDIYSTMLLRNLQSIMVNELSEEVENRNKNRRYEYKINDSITIGALNENLIELFSSSKKEVLNKLKKIFITKIVPIRPNRQEIRKKGKYKNRTKPKVLKNRKRVL